VSGRAEDLELPEDLTKGGGELLAPGLGLLGADVQGIEPFSGDRAGGESGLGHGPLPFR
jgi:hypothetical protein